MDKQKYRRLNLKNGWDLPEGEKAPMTGRKQQTARAYELLIEKTDEEYVREAEIARHDREIAEAKKRIRFLQEAIGIEKASPGTFAQPQKTDSFQQKDHNQPDTPPDSASNDSDISDAAKWENELRDQTDNRWKKRRRRILGIVLSLIALAVLGVGGRLLFGPPVLIADISSYEDVEIIIEGLDDEPFTVTPGQLADMKLDSVKVDVHEVELLPDQVQERGKAIGPTLETFLDEFGYSIDDIRSMKVYNGKDASTAYVHTLTEEKIVLSVANGRKALGDKEAPLRIAVADTDAGEWAGWIRRIVFTLK